MLWFDVGTGVRTTSSHISLYVLQLWFDVGTGVRTTRGMIVSGLSMLWFDVGTGVRTTQIGSYNFNACCGLM